MFCMGSSSPSTIWDKIVPSLLPDGYVRRTKEGETSGECSNGPPTQNHFYPAKKPLTWLCPLDQKCLTHFVVLSVWGRTFPWPKWMPRHCILSCLIEQLFGCAVRPTCFRVLGKLANVVNTVAILCYKWLYNLNTPWYMCCVRRVICTFTLKWFLNISGVPNKASRRVTQIFLR